MTIGPGSGEYWIGPPGSLRRPKTKSPISGSSVTATCERLRVANGLNGMRLPLIRQRLLHVLVVRIFLRSARHNLHTPDR